jgi:putative membrane protein
MMGGWTVSMPLVALSTLLFWVAVVLGLIAIVRWAVADASARDEQASNALEIARVRYARGEISREEFERLREDLVRAS